jgi:hypothetical protein
MIRCQFFDAGPWVHGFASNVLNLCNQRNLRILYLRDLAFSRPCKRFQRPTLWFPPDPDMISLIMRR